ncbi:MAG: crosslink repair DNA glycosylase YcaQ family protein [Pseudomonadota bacterium]
MLKLSTSDVRRLSLHAQGLDKTLPFGKGRAAVLRCIEQLGYIQIDTISVIKRAHHHTCWTRVPGYQEMHLDELQQARKIFEYWSHAAAYLPMQDYRYCLPRMHAITAGEKHWHKPQLKLMQFALDRIRAEGPLQAKDFEQDTSRKQGGWWQWKPSKKALEQLFIQGQLVVSHRSGFQKVYDLPERVLPTDIDISVPTPEEFRRFLILRAIRAHGAVCESEISYLRKGIKKALSLSLVDMLEAGELVALTYPGAVNRMFSTPAMLEQVAKIRLSRQVHLLSPFDNLVIQRKRLQDLFGFDYQLECYVPEGKRKYGYYCLPILYGTELVGRLDPKAERKTGVLEIRNLVLEDGAKTDEAFARLFAERLVSLAAFNNCSAIIIGACNNRLFKALLKQQLANAEIGNSIK